LGKLGHGTGQGTLLNLGFLFIISATGKYSDFSFGMPLGLAKAYHKTHPDEQVVVAIGVHCELVRIEKLFLKNRPSNYKY